MTIVERIENGMRMNEMRKERSYALLSTMDLSVPDVVGSTAF
jgi:hypothetical protein